MSTWLLVTLLLRFQLSEQTFFLLILCLALTLTKPAAVGVWIVHVSVKYLAAASLRAEFNSRPSRIRSWPRCSCLPAGKKAHYALLDSLCASGEAQPRRNSAITAQGGGASQRSAGPTAGSISGFGLLSSVLCPFWWL